MSIVKMTDLDLAGKRVLIRQDLNVPIKAGNISSDARIVASLPTIKFALEQNAKLMISTHLGRPVEGQYNPDWSLRPIVDYMKTKLGLPVRLVTDYLDGDIKIAAGEVVVLENARFNKGEMANDKTLAKKLAALCDIYVMDAFGTAHRAQASTHGVGLFAPVACAGPLLMRELNALSRALHKPARPMVAIVGGAKVSTKLTILKSLSHIADQIIVGGGIANTFIAAKGYEVGQSLYEPSLISSAKELMTKCDIPIANDVCTAKTFSASAKSIIKPVTEVDKQDMILDLGPSSAKQLVKMLQTAKTILWNGPIGVFEFPCFAEGTKVVAEAIANNDAFSIAGGGDTLAAIDQFNIKEQISYISTGGGAFLEFIENKKLPAVAMLEARGE